MNRANFQVLAELRLRESKGLLEAGFPHGAYYLAGYAIECALKACVAKQTREHDFPDKKLVNDSHTHDIGKLIQLADLRVELENSMATNPMLRANVDTVKDWSEAARYQTKMEQEAQDLVQAIEDPKGGLLPWIKLHW